MIRLVAEREIRTRLRSKFLWGSALLLLVAPIVAALIQRAVGDDRPAVYRVAITASTDQTTLRASAAQFGVGLALREIPDAPADDAAARAVFDREAVGAIYDGQHGRLIGERDVAETLRLVVTGAWNRQRLVAAGVTDAQLRDLDARPPLEVRLADPRSDRDALRSVIAAAAGIALFLVLQIFGGSVGTGVVEEKTTAVAEVLLGRASAFQLIAGKTIGATLAALPQMLALTLGAVAGLFIVGVDVPAAAWGAVASILVWFVGGLLLYCSLFALMSSFASRTEDAQAAMAPVVIALIAGYLLSFVVADDPSAWWTRALAVVPLLAPFLMPGVIAAGEATWWLVAVALVLLPLAIWGVLRVGGAIYGTTLLRRGSRMRFGDVVAMLRGEDLVRSNERAAR